MHNRAINYLSQAWEGGAGKPVCSGSEGMEQIPKARPEKPGVSLGLFPVTPWLPSSCPLPGFGAGQAALFLEGRGDRYNEWLLLCNISTPFWLPSDGMENVPPRAAAKINKTYSLNLAVCFTQTGSSLSSTLKQEFSLTIFRPCSAECNSQRKYLGEKN